MCHRTSPDKYGRAKNNDGQYYFIIYSYGENGIDEKGKGDDIRAPDYIPDYIYWSEKENCFLVDEQARESSIQEGRKIHPLPKQEDKSAPVPDSGEKGNK